MEINWITVAAQIVNFLVLVWLLKHFLYRPVLRAMDQREQRIVDRLGEAEEREQQAEEMVQRYQEKADELERRREDVLDETKEEADRQKNRLLDEAREEVAQTRANWQRQADQEKQEFLDNLGHHSAEVVQAIARHALQSLADAGLEERMVEVFIARLKSLDKDSRKTMAQASGPVRVSSAFELESTLRSRLTRAIHEQLREGIEIDYQQSPELLCGIEIASGGQRVAWHLADYLDQLRERIEQTFEPLESVMTEA
jgi:F-type H+-transporting ATPase subunit b